MPTKKPIHQLSVAQFEKAFPDEEACCAYLVGKQGQQTDIISKQHALSRMQFLAAHRPELITVEFGVINAGTATGNVTGSAVYLDYRWDEDRPYLPTLVKNDLIYPRPFLVGTTDAKYRRTDMEGSTASIRSTPKTCI
jgi:hypothetical protein